MYFLKRHPLSTCKAQTMMEYLLVMVVVVVIVFLAFRNTSNSMLARTQNTTMAYFDTGTAAIVGGHYDGTKFVQAGLQPVNGGWCAYTICVNGFKVRECACPRPAFGGAACAGDAVSDDCGGVTPPPQKCYRYRCHLGFGEQGGTTECTCPTPVDPGCNPGDETWVCHYKTNAEECGYCCSWDGSNCVRSYVGECGSVLGECTQ